MIKKSWEISQPDIRQDPITYATVKIISLVKVSPLAAGSVLWRYSADAAKPEDDCNRSGRDDFRPG